MTDECRKLIKPGDLVIHLGDVAFNFFDLKAWLASIPATWVLVRGNHDSATVTHYMQQGFAFVCDAFVMGGCYFTHKPVATLPTGCSFNVHGHLHNTVPTDYRAFPHCRLFSLEHSLYKPMQLDKFLHRGCPGGEILPPSYRKLGQELIHYEYGDAKGPDLIIPQGDL